MRRSPLLVVLALCACGPNNPPDESSASPPPAHEPGTISLTGPASVDAQAGALTLPLDHVRSAEVLWVRELTLGTYHRIGGVAVNRVNATLVLEYVTEPHPDGSDYFPLRTGLLRQFDRAGREQHSLSSSNVVPDSYAPLSTVMPVGDGFAVIGDYEFLSDSWGRPTFQCTDGAAPSVVFDGRLSCLRALPSRVSGRIASVVISDEGLLWLAYTVQGRAGMLAPLAKYAPTGELLLNGSEYYPTFVPLQQRSERLVAIAGTSVGEMDEDFNLLWERDVGARLKGLTAFSTGGFGAVIPAATTERVLDGQPLPAGQEGLATLDGSGVVQRVVPIRDTTAYWPVSDDYGIALIKQRGIVTYAWDGTRFERALITEATGDASVEHVVLAGKTELRAIVGLAPGVSVTIGTERFAAEDRWRTFLVALLR